MQAGDADPRAEGHARPLPDRPLRGRVGRLQPDPHRRGVRQAGRPAGRILHGLWTMAQVARAPDRGRPAARTALKPAVGRSSAAWACPSRRSSVDRHGARGARRRRASSHTVRRAGRQGDHPQRRGRDRGRVAGVDAGADLQSVVVLTPRQELILRKVVEAHHGDRRARGLEDAGRRPRARLRARRRSATSSAMLEEHGLLAHPHTSAGRVPTDAGTASTSTACCARPAAPRATAARPAARAPRGRRGDARHHRDALAGHQPAGDRLRAADRHGHDPPRRGPAAPAAGR